MHYTSLVPQGLTRNTATYEYNAGLAVDDQIHTFFAHGLAKHGQQPPPGFN